MNTDKNFYKNFILLLLVQVSYGFCFSTFTLLPKYLTLQLKASASDIGNLGAAYGLAILVAYFILGKWSDRLGRKPFIIIGAAFSIISSFCFLLIKDIGLLIYILRIMQGFTFAFLFTSCFTVVADICPPQHLGRILGYFGISMLITNGIAPYIFEPVADKYGWDYVFIATTIFSLAAFIIAFFIKENRETLSSPETDDRSLESDDFPVKKFLTILVSVIAAGSCLNILNSYYQPFAIELGLRQLSSYFVGFTIAAIITRLFLAGLSDRIGRLRMSVIGLVFYGSSAILIIWLQYLSLGIIGAVLGLAHGLFFTSMNAYAIEGVSRKMRGRVMAYYNAAFNLGTTIGVWLVGPVIEMSGYNTVFIATGIFVYLSIFILLIKKYK